MSPTSNAGPGHPRRWGRPHLLDPAVTKGVFDHLRKGEYLLMGEKLARLSPGGAHPGPLVAEGRTNGQIAGELGLAEKTAKNYVSSIPSKLEVARRAEAAAYLARHSTHSAAADDCPSRRNGI
jgi:hypothetical protein